MSGFTGCLEASHSTSVCRCFCVHTHITAQVDLVPTANYHTSHVQADPQAPMNFLVLKRHVESAPPAQDHTARKS